MMHDIGYPPSRLALPEWTALFCIIALSLFPCSAEQPENPDIYQLAENMSLDNPNHWTALGEFYSSAGDFRKAEEMFREGVGRYPDDSNLLSDLGESLIAQGRYADAREPLTRCIVYKPFASPYLVNLGTAYALSGDYSSAIPLYTRALSLTPGYLLAENDLTLAYLNSGQYAEAADASIRSLSIYPHDPVPWINLGLSLEADGHYHDAKLALLKGLSEDPVDADRVQADKALTRAQKNLTRSTPLSPEQSEKISRLLQKQADTPDPAILYPRLFPSDKIGTRILNITVPYKNKEHLIKVPVNLSLYNGAAASYKGSILNEERKETPEEQASYYSAFIRETAEEEMIQAISSQLQDILQQYPDGSFIDIATSFVRASEPDMTSTELHFPVESLVRGKSDCDDRTVLLASLLVRQGYDLAILQFPEHVVLGLRDGQGNYRGTGYTVIDPTQSAPPGVISAYYDQQPLNLFDITF